MLLSPLVSKFLQIVRIWCSFRSHPYLFIISENSCLLIKLSWLLSIIRKVDVLLWHRSHSFSASCFVIKSMLENEKLSSSMWDSVLSAHKSRVGNSLLEDLDGVVSTVKLNHKAPGVVLRPAGNELRAEAHHHLVVFQ